MPVLGHSYSEKLLSKVQREPLVFWFVFITSCPITVHQWKEAGSLVFVLPLWVLICFDKMLLSFSFSRLDSYSFSAFPCVRDASVPSHVQALLWTFSSRSHLYWRPTTGPSTAVVSPMLSRRGGFLSLLPTLLLMQPGIPSTFVVARATVLSWF